MKKAITLILLSSIIFSIVFCLSSCSSKSSTTNTSYNPSYSTNNDSSKSSSYSSDKSYSSNYKKSTSKSNSSFTNAYGTPTTKCAHLGCNNYIASSGDTNCCTLHSNKCAECGKYIDEDALYCISCLKRAAEQVYNDKYK